MYFLIRYEQDNKLVNKTKLQYLNYSETRIFHLYDSQQLKSYHFLILIYYNGRDKPESFVLSRKQQINNLYHDGYYYLQIRCIY